MGVPLTYMDFAPEPPAPTATPVITTEMNCNPSHDTKDLSRKSHVHVSLLQLRFLFIIKGINIINKKSHYFIFILMPGIIHMLSHTKNLCSKLEELQEFSKSFRFENTIYLKHIFPSDTTNGWTPTYCII